MSQEMEIALLGASFGAVLMPMLFLSSGLAIDYLEQNHGTYANDILLGE